MVPENSGHHVDSVSSSEGLFSIRICESRQEMLMYRIMPISKVPILHLFQDETGTHARNVRRLGSCLCSRPKVEYAHDQKDVDPRIILLLSFQSICLANSHCALI